MTDLYTDLAQRFGEDIAEVGQPDEVAAVARAAQTLQGLASRRSHRAFSERPVSLELLRLLCAVALSAPSKSDLQQRDIIIIDEPEQLQALKACVCEQAWTGSIERLLVFCGNNKRQRVVHEKRGHPFANDHLDAFFNAAVDAGIALQAFITAAEATGLACCPLSAIRNDAHAVSRILALPDYVFPVAGLAVGWPAEVGAMSYRLPLTTTVHVNRHDDTQLEAEIAAYDARRAEHQPYVKQRDTERFGAIPAADYGWSEDKARQYAAPERTEFGAFIATKGFRLA